jgi:hypothetical protein
MPLLRGYSVSGMYVCMYVCLSSMGVVKGGKRTGRAHSRDRLHLGGDRLTTYHDCSS